MMKEGKMDQPPAQESDSEAEYNALKDKFERAMKESELDGDMIYKDRVVLKEAGNFLNAATTQEDLKRRMDDIDSIAMDKCGSGARGSQSREYLMSEIMKEALVSRLPKEEAE